MRKWIAGGLLLASLTLAGCGGPRVELTETHKDGDVRWAYYEVTTDTKSRDEELRIVREIRDERTAPHDVVYVIFSRGSHAVIVTTKAGLKQDKEIAKDQHDEAVRAWNSADNIYLWHIS